MYGNTLGSLDITSSVLQIVKQSASVEPRFVICDRNPREGLKLEKLTVASINLTARRFGVDCTARRHEHKRYPDITFDLKGTTGGAIDCRSWTWTSNHKDKIYGSREGYGSARRGRGLDGTRFDMISRYLDATGRQGLLAVELTTTNGRGYHEKRIYAVPWTVLNEALSTDCGLPINDVLRCPSFGRGPSGRYYDLDPRELMQIAEEWRL